MALSYVDYTGDGSNTDFNVTFPYLAKTHVHVYINGTETTAFIWLSASQIRLTTAPANAVIVRVKRTSPTAARLVDFQNGVTLDANADLDQDSNQLFYITQESLDNAGTGGALGSAAVDSFTGNGTNTIYVLTSPPDTTLPITVTVDGVALVAGVGYTLTGQNLVLTSPPAPGSVVAVTYTTLVASSGTGLGSATFDAAITYDIFTGNGSTPSFTLKAPPGNLAAMDVAINGVVKTPGTDYLLTGQVITFTTAPAAAANILVRYAATLAATAESVIQESRIATENQAVFLLTATYQPGAQTMMVYQNGLRLTPGTDYAETDSTTVTILTNVDVLDQFLFVYGNPINGETVDGTRLIDATVTGAKLANATVSLAKLDTALQTQLASVAREPGEVVPFMRSTAPTGWVKANGMTIGSAASAATLRANADTSALYTLLWTEFSNTILVIQTSAGVPSTRGASAAADFAADKRLPVHDLRGEFVRGFDDSRGVDAARVLGSAQLDELKSHSHANTVTNGTGIGSGGGFGYSSGLTGGAETRPRNVALLYCIKL